MPRSRAVISFARVGRPWRPHVLAAMVACAAAAFASAEEPVTEAVRVRALRPEEARRPLRVVIRGVVTTANGRSCVAQDASGPVFIEPADGVWSRRPAVGEIWEFAGVTDAGEFSPVVVAARVARLGGADLPRPIRPSREQLFNGSLDVELVEVQGVLLGTTAEETTLLVPGGVVKIMSHRDYPLPDPPAEPDGRPLQPGSLIRVRGVFFAYRDSATRQLIPGRFLLGDPQLFVDERAPADPFAGPARRAEELLRFDARADGLRRFKVAGQVLHARTGEYFLRDGGNGLRVRTRDPIPPAAGDLVEAVGFPQLGGPSPVLFEAVTRRTGRQPLPAPRDLADADLVHEKHDAARVRVEASLVGEQERLGERVLELQAGRHPFLARLRGTGAIGGEELRVGASLRLTGVYASLRGASDREGFSGFELLLQSRGDIELLQNGPWWTARHTFAALAALSAGLTALLAWIVALRRTVAHRTSLLEEEVRARQLVEHRRLLEQERARVAQDLHDELGAGLTQIGLLGSLAGRADVAPGHVRGHLADIAGKAREMVAVLDEIVWAINPTHDTAGSVSGYLCDYAQEFFRASAIVCRFDADCARPDLVLNSRRRHQLFLAFKEVLTNIVKHADATEVRVRIATAASGLSVVVEDNGKGLLPALAGAGGNGTANMRARLVKAGGSCEIEARPAGGTVVSLNLPEGG